MKIIEVKILFISLLVSIAIVAPPGNRKKRNFIKAAGLGDVAKVKQALKMVDTKTLGKALSSAAINGHFKIVKLLIENDADIVEAVRDAPLKTVKFLIENGANFDTRVKNEALRLASGDGCLEKVKFLIENRANVNAITNPGIDLGHKTALKTAVGMDQLEVVKFLIENRADVDSVEPNGGTILMTAVSVGQLEIIKFLIENRADINAVESNYNGTFTALSIAAKSEKDSIGLDKPIWREIISRLLATDANPLDGTTALELSETIREHMRKKTPEILIKKVASELSLTFPRDLAKVIADYAYRNLPEGELAQ